MSIRAFELAPVLDRLQFLGDKTKMTIECLDSSGKMLYLGANDSFVMKYAVEETTQPNGKVSYACRKEAQKYLGFRKPILEMKAASALNRLFVNCDSTFIILNMFDLEPVVGASRIKGVTTFCVNDNPRNNNPFSMQICIARKKQIAIYNIVEDKAIHLKDISLTDPIVSLAMDGLFVCAALSNQYVIVNCETSYVQDLFPYDLEFTIPLVKRISKEEFLLNGPNSLGMFVTAAGISERPPLQWVENTLSATYNHPYILTIDSHYIYVYSMLDHNVKQNLQFQGSKLIGNFDGKLFVASHVSVYALIPVPWEKQVKALLADERITEALELAEHAYKAGISKEQFTKIFQQIQQQAAFIYLSKFQFEEAKELFINSQMDLRELVSLYPNLLPSSSSFTRHSPPLHSIADIHQMCQGNADLIAECKKFLILYLEEVRALTLTQELQMYLDIALFKLYAETNSPELTSLVVSLDESHNQEELVEWLEKYERYSALGLFYRICNRNDKALEIWTKILNGEFMDESFQGFNFYVEFLANLSDHSLVWKYADFVLEKDQEDGVKIFTERPSVDVEPEQMKADEVVEYLHRYPQALLKYLEYLVFNCQNQKEKFHTHLAVLYLDIILDLMKNSELDAQELENARKRFREHLLSSSLYRVQLILGKIPNSHLQLETAILYGKLEEHEKALRILVHDLNDHQAASEYCRRNAQSKPKKYRQHLFHSLLAVYMDPRLSQDRQEELLTPAVQLLNSDTAEFDTAKIIELLPPHWSVATIEKFLSRGLRKSLHTRRSRSLECRLSRCENVQIKFDRYDLVREPTVVTEDRICVVCSRPFTEPNFIHFPNGLVTHTHCSRSTIYCPDTGKLMRRTNENEDR